MSPHSGCPVSLILSRSLSGARRQLIKNDHRHRLLVRQFLRFSTEGRIGPQHPLQSAEVGIGGITGDADRTGFKAGEAAGFLLRRGDPVPAEADIETLAR